MSAVPLVSVALLPLAAVLAAPDARATHGAASTAPDRLDDWVGDARAGRLPATDALDAALLAAGERRALEFTRELERLAAPDGARAGSALPALRAAVAGYPARVADAISAGGTAGVAATDRVDVALAVLEAIADPPAVVLAGRLGDLRLAAGGRPGGTRARVQGVVERALERDPREAADALAEGYIECGDELTPAFVDALARRALPGRLSALVDLIGRRPAADGLVLNRVESLARKLGPVLDPHAVGRVRDALGAPEAFARAGAARAVGALEDQGAVDGLAALLDDPDRTVRAAAHDSLRALTAMAFGPAPARWSAWLAREREWWTTRGRSDLAAIESADRRELLLTLREAALHRLYRDEISVAVAPLLRAGDPLVVQLALATLESVRARDVVHDVADLLEHESREIREQALRCLRALTGRTLGSDPRAWRRAIGG